MQFCSSKVIIAYYICFCRKLPISFDYATLHLCTATLSFDHLPVVLSDMFSIQVKNIGFTGVFRLIFKPLVEELPCFGAVSYSLIEKVNLYYLSNILAFYLQVILHANGTPFPNCRKI